MAISNFIALLLLIVAVGASTKYIRETKGMSLLVCFLFLLFLIPISVSTNAAHLRMQHCAAQQPKKYEPPEIISGLPADRDAILVHLVDNKGLSISEAMRVIKSKEVDQFITDSSIADMEEKQCSDNAELIKLWETSSGLRGFAWWYFNNLKYDPYRPLFVLIS